MQIRQYPNGWCTRKARWKTQPNTKIEATVVKKGNAMPGLVIMSNRLIRIAIAFIHAIRTEYSTMKTTLSRISTN
ncbi:hypothetical protein [Nostoc sp.]|uniref:hypothetical protein n=1 Tax=Nostoc sp. TaxID=1180 RepID=UPI002FF5E03F